MHTDTSEPVPVFDEISISQRVKLIPTDAELNKKLIPLQYYVTRHDGTEPPFNNKYWDNKEPAECFYEF